MKNIHEILERLRRLPSETETGWMTARKLSQGSGTFDIMQSVAEMIRKNRGEGAQVIENTSKLSSEQHSSTLLLYDPIYVSLFLALPLLPPPSFRGVRVISNTTGEIKVEYTKDDDWIDMQKPQGGTIEDFRRCIYNALQQSEPVPILIGFPDLSRSKPLISN